MNEDEKAKNALDVVNGISAVTCTAGLVGSNLKKGSTRI